MIADSLEFFFAHEYAHISSDTPDLQKIKSDNVLSYSLLEKIAKMLIMHALLAC